MHNKLSCDFKKGLSKQYLSCCFCGVILLCSLIFSPSLLASPDEEFNALEKKLQETVGEISFGFLDSAIKAKIPKSENDALLKRRDGLVALGLKKTSNEVKTRFFEVVVSQEVPVPKQENLVNLVLANISENEVLSFIKNIRIKRLYALPSAETVELMLKNGFDNLELMRLVVQIPISLNDSIQANKQITLLMSIVLFAKKHTKPVNTDEVEKEILTEWQYRKRLNARSLRYLFEEKYDIDTICKNLLAQGVDPNELYTVIKRLGNYNYGMGIYVEHDDASLEKLRGNLLDLVRNYEGFSDELAAKFSEQAETEEFDPETVKFTQMETLASWVASKYHKYPEMMRKLQRIVSYLIPQNLEGQDKAFNKSIPQDKKNEGVSYGYSWHTSGAVELAFLRKVNEISKRKKDIITLEMGAAEGYVSWKVPLAFEQGGTHYVNEINETVIEQVFKEMVPAIYRRLGVFELWNSVKMTPGDCLEILSKCPELEGKVDVIIVLNVEHFLTPEGHQKLIKLMDKLLVPGGYAYLSALSPTGFCGENEELQKILIENENDGNRKSTYYAWFKKTEKYNEMTMQLLSEKSDDGTVNEICHRSDDKYSTYLCFTPEIYRRSVKQSSTNLEVEGAFFVNQFGHIVSRDYSNCYYCANDKAFAIVHKPKDWFDEFGL